MPVIRPASPGDLPLVAQVSLLSWKAAYSGILPDSLLDGLSLDERTTLWRGVLAREDVLYSCILEEEGQGIGFGVLGSGKMRTHPDDTVELYSTYLLPAHWGRGHGTALLDHCIEWARTNGYRHVVLSVFAENERARRVYQRFGFLQQGEPQPVRLMEGEEVDEVWYSLDLRT